MFIIRCLSLLFLTFFIFEVSGQLPEEERIVDKVSIRDARLSTEARAWAKGEILVLNTLVSELLPQSKMVYSLSIQTVEHNQVVKYSFFSGRKMVLYLPVQSGEAFLDNEGLLAIIDGLVRSRVMVPHNNPSSYNHLLPQWILSGVLHRFYSRLNQVSPLHEQQIQEGGWYIELNSEMITQRTGLRNYAFPRIRYLLDREIALPLPIDMIDIPTLVHYDEFSLFQEEYANVMLSYVEYILRRDFEKTLIMLCRKRINHKQTEEASWLEIIQDAPSYSISFIDYVDYIVYTANSHKSSDLISNSYFSDIRENIWVKLNVVDPKFPDSIRIEDKIIFLGDLGKVYTQLSNPLDVQKQIGTQIFNLKSKATFRLRPILTQIEKLIVELNNENASHFYAQFSSAERDFVLAIEQDRKMQEYLQVVETYYATYHDIIQSRIQMIREIRNRHELQKNDALNEWLDQVENAEKLGCY